MKQVSEFETYAELIAYETTSKIRMISSDVMTMMLVKFGLYGFFLSRVDDISLAFMDRVRAVSTFNFVTGSVMGEANKSMMQTVVDNNPDLIEQLTALRLALIDYANPTYFPYVEMTETQFDEIKNPPVVEPASPPPVYEYFDQIPSQTGNFISRLRLDSPPSRAATVHVYERISKDGVIWLEWKRVGYFGSVRNDVEEYSASVKATTAAHRQFKIVSDVELDIQG